MEERSTPSSFSIVAVDLSFILSSFPRALLARPSSNIFIKRFRLDLLWPEFLRSGASSLLFSFVKW